MSEGLMDKSGYWREQWYGSDPLKGAAIWKCTKFGTSGDLLFHIGPGKEHLELTRKICAEHNATLDELIAAAPFLLAVQVNTADTFALVKALSRLAGNRHSDGVSSLVSAEDRTVIIDGCYDLMIASKAQPSAARMLALEEAARAAENAVLEYNLSECAGLADWAAFEAGQESGLKHAAAAIRALSSPDHADADTIETYYARQIEWSKSTFGPALRTKGIIDHIKKELKEIEAEPHDLSEWIDVVILAMDGFWRHGGSVADLLPRLIAKQQKNMARTWPDWRTMSEDQAIEHDRAQEPDHNADAGKVEGDDGRPCSMDEFMAALFNEKVDEFDVSEAAASWLHGDWKDALSYLTDVPTHWRPLPSAPSQAEGGA